MGYYESTVEKALKDKVIELKKPEYQNVLMQYDNWTYHIRLSMIPNSAYLKYTELKSELLMGKNVKNKMNQIIEESSITIAETGVISNPFIESFIMKSFMSVNKVSTTNMNMKLVDTQGIGLENKVNTLSMILGYGYNFVNQPFFITVWFTGYNETNKNTGSNELRLGQPEKVIPIYSQAKNQENTKIDDKLYFEVCASKVNSDITTSRAVWDFNFSVVDNAGFIPKDTIVLSDVGNIVVKKGENYITTIAKQLTEKITKKVQDKLGKSNFDIIYCNDNKSSSSIPNCVDVKIFNPDGTLYYSTDIKDKGIDGFDGVNPNPKGDTYIDYVKNNNQDKHVVTIGTDANLLSVFTKLIIENKICGKEGGWFTKKIEDTKIYSSNTGIVPRIYVTNVLKGSYAGDTYYKTNINVFFENRKDMDLMMKDGAEFFSNVVPAQKEIIKNTKFLRLYEWMTGNNENKLLDFKTNTNNLWFLNTGITAMENARQNTPSAKNWRKIPVTDELAKSRDQVLAKMGNPFNIPASFKTMNEYWDYVIEKNVFESLLLPSFTMRDDDVTSDDIKTASSETEEENVLKTRSRIGFNNLVTSGNATSLDLNIIGDPMWLDIASVLSPKDRTKYLTISIIFKKNSNFHMDNHDLYKQEPLTQFILPYSITQITSTFTNGAFKQQLKGHINAAFLIDKYQAEELQKSFSKATNSSGSGGGR